MKDIDSPEAARMRAADPSILFLDVRSREEFEEGHPEGAVNVPVAEPDDSGQMAPNPDFVAVVRALAPDASRTILASCAMGGRSRMACQILEGAGYSNTFNVDGGFHGRRNPILRTLVVPGWKDAGLPVSTGTGDGVGYDSLKRKAGL